MNSSGPAALVQGLEKARIDVTLEELFDALTLYRLGMRAPQEAVAHDPRVAPPPEGPQPQSTHTPETELPTDESGPAEQLVQVLAKPGTGVYLPQPRWAEHSQDEAGGSLVQVPTVPALREKLRLGRALRPLKRTVPSPSLRVVDIAETARRSAMMRLPSPASKPAPERWLDAVLIIDRSGSHQVWEDTVRETSTLLQTHGAFRCLQTWYLNAQPHGAVTLTDRFGVQVPAGAPVPGPRRLVIVLTDGVAPYWQGHQIRELIRRWSSVSPVVLAQLLPRRLWGRSGIRPTPVFFHTSNAGYDGRLRFTDYYGERDASTHIAVPLVELSETWIDPWATMAAGRADDGSPGAAWLIERKAPPHAPPQAAEVRPKLEMATAAAARDAVLAFRATVSPTAFQLARYLAAAGDYLRLPVMRAVQAAVLPDSEPADLAEVFLSGLLEPAVNENGTTVQGLFTFAAGVAAQLAGGMPRHQMTDAGLSLGWYISGRSGTTPRRSFDAYVPGPDAGTGRLRLAPAPLALLTSVMSRLMGVAPGAGPVSTHLGQETGEIQIQVPEPPVFAVAGHAVDEAWTDWVESTLIRLGGRVKRFRWTSRGVTRNTRTWSDLKCNKLVVVTSRSLRSAQWLSSEGKNGAQGSDLDARILWVPGENLPAGLRERATVLFPGDEQASERALRRFVVDAVQGVQPELDDTVQLLRTSMAGPDSPPAGPNRFPGTATFVHNLKPRHPFFIGRAGELSAIRGALWRQSGRGVPACVIAGPAGSGKTELVIEYAHENAEDYDLVWMVRADDRATLEADLESFRTALAALTDSDKQAPTEYSWWWLPPRCLLIYHLVARPEVLAGFWPSGGEGHVLVTTWSAAPWAEAVPAAVELGHLEPAAAVEAIRLGQLVNDRELDSADLRRLPGYLNQHTSMPLGLAHLATTLGATGGPTLREFLDSTNSTRAPDRKPDVPRSGVPIGLVGGPGSGKTTFAAVLPIAADQYTHRWGAAWNVAALDDRSLDFHIQQLDRLQTKQIFPSQTLLPNYYSWSLRRSIEERRRSWRGRIVTVREQKISLDLCDVPGSVYERLPDVWASDVLEPVYNASGLVYLFDAAYESPRSALGLVQGVLARLSTEARARGAMPGGYLPQRLAVCIAKFDRRPLVRLTQEFGLLTSHPTTGEPRVSPQDASLLFSRLCRLHPDFTEIDRAIRRMFDPDRVRYFATSAVGFYSPKRGPLDMEDCENRVEHDAAVFIRGTVRPMNVLEPLLWAGGSPAPD